MFGRTSLVDASDVIGFSYSGRYEDCSTRSAHSESTYPVVRTAPGPQDGIGEITETVLPVYEATDTCNGVAAAAQRLALLVQRVVDESPNSRLVLVGHSMGGMVAAYYLSTLVPLAVQDRLQAVVTLDSPLQGTSFRGPLSSCLATDVAWQDIAGNTHVVVDIGALRSSSVVSKLFAINSTEVGDHVPGSYFWESGCAVGGTLLGLLTGGHSCSFYDDESLTKISALVNGEPVSGFNTVTATIDSLDRTPMAVRSDSQGEIGFTFTNTGSVSWSFGALITTRRSSGMTSDSFVGVTLAPTEERTVTFPVRWGEPGARDVRVSVCRESSSAAHCRTLLADTGWLLSYITVQP